MADRTILLDPIFERWKDQPSSRENWKKFKAELSEPTYVQMNLTEVRKWLDSPNKDLNELGRHLGKLECMRGLVNRLQDKGALPWATLEELRQPLNEMLGQISRIQIEAAYGRAIFPINLVPLLPAIALHTIFAMVWRPCIPADKAELTEPTGATGQTF